jgi:hypothetical protein
LVKIVDYGAALKRAVLGTSSAPCHSSTILIK